MAHISEQRKSRTLTTPNADEDMEKLLGLIKAVQWLRLHVQCRGHALDP